ncbi:hypothetical protein FRB97_008580 [Tulasnella sp. 331]|nr:hypothetical protein FRB97_008580 [Tulasnella sp. 331]KAG8874448.1 hypothetical protein FRB98_008430 [Tulasnella sp. 332]
MAIPIVVIGNTADPTTPLHIAKELARTLNSDKERNAALIQQDGYGHTSLCEPSLCTQALTRAYFIHGAPSVVNSLPFLYGSVPASTEVISSPLT